MDGGERVVMFDRFRGILEETVDEGTHFLIPWVQTAHIFDIRTRPRSIPSVTGTKDLQMVNITLRVLTKPDKQKLPAIFVRYGVDWEERVLPSIANEILKSVVAQYNAEELLTKRDAVSQKIRSDLMTRAKDFNVLLDDVAITHLAFGSEFSRAIEAKQVAEQDAERAKYVVMKADQERKAAVIIAEGESESARLISQATRSYGQGLIELRRIEAAKEIAAELAGSRNVVYLPNQSNMLLKRSGPAQTAVPPAASPPLNPQPAQPALPCQRGFRHQGRGGKCRVPPRAQRPRIREAEIFPVRYDTRAPALPEGDRGRPPRLPPPPPLPLRLAAAVEEAPGGEEEAEEPGALHGGLPDVPQLVQARDLVPERLVRPEHRPHRPAQRRAQRRARGHPVRAPRVHRRASG